MVIVTAAIEQKAKFKGIAVATGALAAASALKVALSTQAITLRHFVTPPSQHSDDGACNYEAFPTAEYGSIDHQYGGRQYWEGLQG